MEEWNLEGEYRFQDDGSYTVVMALTSVDWSFWWPSSCLHEPSCLDMDGDSTTCTWSAADGCACNQTLTSDETESGSGVWSTWESDLYFDADDATTYCVDDKGLRFTFTGAGLPPVLLTLTPG